MAASNKNTHLTIAERQIIETGIRNGSTKKSIADTIGKDKSTVGKEIKLHRYLKNKSRYPIDCALFQKCKNRDTFHCTKECSNYRQFECKRRDRSPGACNGCSSHNRCHYDKYIYSADMAEHEYRDQLVNSRTGVNATVNEIRDLGLKIKPLLEQGHSPYVILQNHPEIELSEKTLYSYIENGVFQDAGVSINCLNLKLQVRRKMVKKKKNEYSPRQDRSYLKGRTKVEFEAFMEKNPNASVVEMDTVYNDVAKGPFIQTFKFLKYDLIFCVLHPLKDSDHMRQGILLLESVLGKEIFTREVMVLKTDRGSEFTLGDEIEFRPDGSQGPESSIVILWPAGRKALLKTSMRCSGRSVQKTATSAHLVWIPSSKPTASVLISTRIRKKRLSGPFGCYCRRHPRFYRDSSNFLANEICAVFFCNPDC